MGAALVDGKGMAEKIKQELAKEVEQLKGLGIIPNLAAVQVGENPASQVYVRAQQKSCQNMGIEYKLHTLSAGTSKEDLIKFIEELNNDEKIKGIILQMPLPEGINAREVQRMISPKKDVEGVNPVNMGMLVYGEARIAPCTALAVMEILKQSSVELKGKEAVVVGHSEIVGKPLALLLLQWPLDSATPTICHIATKALAFHVQRAEVLIVAAGKAGLIKGEWIKEGAVVIDVGINRTPDGKIVGDVEFEKAKERASLITPVPGGVGPLTTTMLLKNTIEATKWQSE